MFKNSIDTKDSSLNSPNSGFHNYSPEKKHKQSRNSQSNFPKYIKTRDSNSLPIMGKTALLAKRTGTLKNGEDSDIITNLVMEKFKNILNHYCHRSCTRSKFRKNSSDDAVIDSNNQNDLNNVVEDASPIENEKTVVQNDPEFNHNEDLTFVITMDNEIMSIEKEILNSLKISDTVVSEMASLETTEPNKDIKAEESLEYDAQRFLEAALGDELHNCSDNDSQNDSSDTSTQINKFHEDYSVRTADVSMLVSESDASYYSSFSRKMLRYRDRQLTSSPIYKRPQHSAGRKESAPLECKASQLIQEGAVQHQIIIQISKALNICFDSKEFRSSTEYIEAEKILLLAVQKRETILNELRKSEYEDVDDAGCLGEVQISNLCFTLSEKNEPADDCTEWFVAVVRYGTVVLATKVAMADEDGRVRFKEMFKFENLASDFEIFVGIYSLSVKNDMKNYSHESKFHIETETTTCPGPNKFIAFYKRSNHKQQYKTRYSYERRDPSFMPLGTTIIRIADLTKHLPFKLYQPSNCSNLQGSVTMELSSTIQIKANYSGFLTIGSETGGFAIWNRRWCCLDGRELKYWSYPAEQEFADPIGRIDLSFCVTSYIARVDRELCARPRTLLLELGCLSTSNDENSSVVICESSYTITRYYLSADNMEEMDLWDKKLNCVLFSLRNWNCMKCKLYFKN